MHVDDATFVVTDTETTGTTAQTDRVLEIGAVKLRDGSIVDRFQQLVNPQRSVPGSITELTGITTGMVFDAPTIDQVLPAYLDFLGEGIFVAHNRSFDLDFLNAEGRRVGVEEIKTDALCTERLARRLLPGLASKGLRRLVQFYDIDSNGRHRALGDAEATSRVLRRFLRRLNFEYEIRSVEDVLAFQRRQYNQVGATAPHIKEIQEDVLPAVPDGPGVYELRNGRETPIYIGKANCLPDRLHSHFTAVESKGARKRKMLQKVRSVDWTKTDTEFEALLLESRRIKEEKPRYNRAQRRYYSRPFVRLDTNHEVPTVSWSHRLDADGAEYYGPVRNTDQAEMVVDVIGRFFRLRECDDKRLALGQRCLYADMDRCTAPCETGAGTEYTDQVERVRAFLKGQDPTVITRLRERMEDASSQLAFEKAAEIRDTVETLERILEKQRMAKAPVRSHHGVLLHDRSDRDGVDFLLVRFGQFQESILCSHPPTSTDWDRLRTHCASVFEASTASLDSFSKRDATEIRLLSQWTYAHRDEIRVVHWADEDSIDDLIETVMTMADSLH